MDTVLTENLTKIQAIIIAFVKHNIYLNAIDNYLLLLTITYLNIHSALNLITNHVSTYHFRQIVTIQTVTLDI